MIYFILIYAILKLYFILDIYQQSHYNLKEYFRFFGRNILWLDGCVFLSAVTGLSSKYPIVWICCGIYLILYSIFYFHIKVKLVFSKRIIRLCIGLILYVLGLYWIPFVNAYLLIFIEFSVGIVLWIEGKISSCLNRKYLKSAKEKLDHYQGTKIVITGSYGKTSTKMLFQQVLQVYADTIATVKSYNTPLGISKFIHSSYIDLYSYLVLEYGVSKIGDMKELKELAVADIAVVCEIGYMHINGFKNIENIVKEKMQVIEGSKIAILNYDNPWIRNYPVSNEVVLTYGLEYGMYQAKNVKDGSFDFYYKNQFLVHFDTNLKGIHQILNLLAPLSYIHYLGLDLSLVVRTARLFQVEQNRLQVKRWKDRAILDDSFNSNLNGFIGALKELSKEKGTRVVLTPGIVELGKYKNHIYEELSKHIVANSDIVILVGYSQCKSLYKLLSDYNIELYMVHDFKEGYALYECIAEKCKYSTVLIENDLPDIYRRGLIF